MTGPPPDTVELRAHAKINPFLRVIRRRDDGYHELETLVLPITLADRLTIRAVNDRSQYHTLSYGLEVTGPPALTRDVPSDDTNLAMRAAFAMAHHLHPAGIAHVAIEKWIPAGAGLGGGSADAAGVLRALNDLWGAALDAEALAEIGLSIGSDVPALLAGTPVMARGRGERLEPVRAAAFDWLLVRFPFGVRTADAFGWWDADGAREADTGPDVEPRSTERLLRALAGGDAAALGSSLFNDLEGPVFRRHPEIAAAKARLLAAGLPGAVLCGSGASVAGLLPAGASRHELEPLVEDLTGLSDLGPGYVRSAATRNV
jgi:4-diphosphocytidyl-2-C-methyl-D-erythritol kinase